MENVYLNLDLLRLDTILLDNGCEIVAHIVDKKDSDYRFIQILSDTIDPYIRENEYVSLRQNKNGINYLKRLQELDEGNIIYKGFLVRYKMIDGYFSVIGSGHKYRLVSSFKNNGPEESLLAIPENTLIGAIPEIITKEHFPVFYYYSSDFSSHCVFYDGIKELQEAIRMNMIVMNKSNMFVLKYALKKHNQYENLPI